MSGVDGIGLIGFLPGLLVGAFAVIVLMVDLFSPTRATRELRFDRADRHRPGLLGNNTIVGQ